MEISPQDPAPISMKSLAKVLAKLAPTNPTTFGCNGLTNQLLPFFKFLRALGQCPFLFETIQDREGFRRVNYTFKICGDPRFILSFFVAVFITSGNLIALLNLQFGIAVLGGLWPSNLELQTPRNSSQDEIGIMSTIMIECFGIVSVLVIVVEYFIVWCTSSRLSEWMNEWNDIENDMKNCPGMLHSINLSNFIKYFAIPYIALPTIFLGTPIAMFSIDAKYPVGIVIIITYSYVAISCLHAQDVKVILMFKAIEMSFKQVRQTIQIRYEKKITFLDNYDSLSKTEIRAWQKILIKIRKQAEAAGTYMAVHQLSSIVICIYFASSALFVASNLIGQQKGNEIIPLVVTFTLISFVRVILKISMAVRINQEERRLAKLLKDLEVLEDNEECHNEIKGTYDMLVLCPTEISLCDYVKCNNSLILRICSQVLTQFIVYQQFQNSK